MSFYFKDNQRWTVSKYDALEFRMTVTERETIKCMIIIVTFWQPKIEFNYLSSRRRHRPGRRRLLPGRDRGAQRARPRARRRLRQRQHRQGRRHGRRVWAAQDPGPTVNPSQQSPFGIQLFPHL